ncbi:MAG: hypothetical protein A3C07_05055 [Candidatus Sungbacteria bacterium RIFCSPHIGHO2_02_FULL_47_11]|uniref:GIY-YIG domain-containing protein n=1 Tax=Candidatus Sungbacteria bacterium RIFCSPHIGHO2_02_FULL_47_11 TaxID=1802270 RepID=A0A1G2KMB2_9BACT|nr:MAG: hypothetical protein A3C07_05055 [Candidatus Sungbacteria bacterium RIFCSPHIGHO2_02_FULL_47_11]
MYFVYILLSKKDKRTYAGYTKNVYLRLREHNAGRVSATKHRIPLEVFLTERFKTAQSAKNRELWWKSSTGRKKLKELFARQNT